MPTTGCHGPTKRSSTITAAPSDGHAPYNSLELHMHTRITALV